MPRCRICKEKFIAKYNNQKTCINENCVWEWHKLLKIKEWNKEKKARKENSKTRPQYIKELQVLVNRFIRLRDRKLNCISCGNKLGEKYDAGHYRSVGSCPELRYNELNIHAQCVYCNHHLHGNLINYRKGLLIRIGEKKVEMLESNHPPLKLTVPEIKELIEEYKKKIKEFVY